MLFQSVEKHTTLIIEIKKYSKIDELKKNLLATADLSLTSDLSNQI